jgi:PAS domain-containing protein
MLNAEKYLAAAIESSEGAIMGKNYPRTYLYINIVGQKTSTARKPEVFSFGGRMEKDEGKEKTKEQISAAMEELKIGREAIARLAAIVDSSDDAIIGKNLDGTITNWNPGAERIYGYSAGEAVGNSILIIVPTELRDEVFRDS